MDFVKEFEAFKANTASTAASHGFSELKDNPLFVPTKLAMIMSECAEAIEWHREGKTAELPHELADIVIRTMDLAEVLGINLGQAIVDKNEFNKTRPYKHGSKLY